MKIEAVSEVLQSANLETPTLDVLIPDVSNYTALLMQPHGDIEASHAGVRNRDRDLAKLQFGGFLTFAEQIVADLVVTPEYSMPWEVLTEAIKRGCIPKPGRLWALGCESITYAGLEQAKKDLAGSAIVLYEALLPAMINLLTRSFTYSLLGNKTALLGLCCSFSSRRIQWATMTTLRSTICSAVRAFISSAGQDNS